jgi:lysozyme
MALALSGCGTAPGAAENPRKTSEAIVQCPSPVTEGIDVFDGQGTIDWPSVAAAGVTFAFIKATQGTDNVQATFQLNWAGSQAAGVVRGAYHFFDPTQDGVAQAIHFLSVVGPLAPGDLPPVIDIECPDGAADCLYAGASGAAPPDAIAARMWDFIHTVEETTARKPMIYTFGSYFAANGIDTTGLASYPLFLAAPSSLACVSVPAPWSAAAAWQYSWTGRVSGIEPPVDRDRIVGATADWVDLSATLPPSQGASAGEPPPRPTSTPSPSTTAPLSPPVPTATMTSPSPSPPVPTATMTSPSPAIATATMTSPSPPIPAVAMTSPPVSTATPILPSATRPDSGDAAGPRQSAGCGVGGAGMMANAPHLWSALACLAFVGGVGLVVRKRRLPFATGAC